MGKEETCEVCGSTESKLVDGYYYCVECGTQDTNVRETLVEHQMIDDANYAIGRRIKYAVKMKEGVEMSPEWYKWHTYNFVLAGLTEQLIELGAAPSLRMKVLWIWSRYIKMYQKKDEMSRFKVLSQLEASESSSDGEATEQAERAALLALAKSGPRLDRVGRQVLVAVLALALNLDRSPLQLSHLARLVRWRLLAVNDALRFVPPELARRQHRLELRFYGALFVCNDLPHVMGRLSRMLDLGPPRVPDVEAIVASQLRELRLPPGVGQLVRALMRLLPVPWQLRVRGKEAPRFPDYETTVLAYILVALKMCFGLDDDYEIRLSNTVDRINREEGRPRAYGSDPEPTDRLFCFREWAEYLRRRALGLSRQYGPLAWQRNMRTTDEALMEHFEEFTAACPANNKKTTLLSDEVTMDIIGKIPKRWSAGVLPLKELRRAAAAREPAHALARLVAPRELDEDFTQYSLEYAYRRLALPGDHVFEGVADARKDYRDKIGQHLGSMDADPTIVYIKECENKNWVKTKRPTAAHVVDDEGDPGRGPRGDPRQDSRSPEVDREEDMKLETFEEETEGGNIFDDDFFSFKIKEEKMEAPDSSENIKDETEDINSFEDFCHEFESTRRESVDDKSRTRPEGAGGSRGVFDSDEESGPRYDPHTFNRAETIKQIMIAAYKKYISIETKIPVRFRTAQRSNKEKSVPKCLVEDNNRTEAWVRKRERHDGKTAIDDVVSAYQSSLARDVMQQVAEEVRRFVDAAESQPDLEPPEPMEPENSRTDAADGDPDESRDVQLIENNVMSDDDSSDESAYDPVYKGNAKFDEKTYDASQLFLKLKEVPAPPAAEPGDASFLEHIHPAGHRLLEERKRQRYERDQRIIKWRRMKENIDHLVEDPESITKFNYWFKHYERCRTWKNKVVQVEMDESFPRSFRFVLRECAAALGVAPGLLYPRACDVERALLTLLWRRRPHRRSRKHSLPTSPDEQPKTKIFKNSKNGAKVSKNNKNYGKVSNIRNDSKLSHYTSDDASDSVVISDDARVPQDEDSENEGVSKENVIPADEPAAVPRRRSGRLREKAALDSFWR